MPTRRAIGAVCAATVALVAALTLAGTDRGLALYVYVLALAAITLAILRTRITAATVTTAPLERLLHPRPSSDGQIVQLEALTRRLRGGLTSSFDLHYRLRPLLHEIAAARLARHRGLDLDRQPEQARQFLGAQLWELLRPDRPPPEERFAKGASGRQLSELIDELEAI